MWIRKFFKGGYMRLILAIPIVIAVACMGLIDGMTTSKPNASI